MKFVNSKKAILFTGVLAFAFIFGCTDKKADQVTPSPPPSSGGCDTTNVTFSAVVNPIIQNSCALSGCHTNATRAGGYTYESYTGLMRAVNNGRLLGAIRHGNGYVAMPQSAPKLSDCDIEKITHWVNMGAPNN